MSKAHSTKSPALPTAILKNMIFEMIMKILNFSQKFLLVHNKYLEIQI